VRQIIDSLNMAQREQLERIKIVKVPSQSRAAHASRARTRTHTRAYMHTRARARTVQIKERLGVVRKAVDEYSLIGKVGR
jgi:hypothetical protein